MNHRPNEKLAGQYVAVTVSPSVVVASMVYPPTPGGLGT